MAKTAAYWQKGDSLDYTNKTDQTIPAGTVLVFGKRMGVAGTEIPAGGTGSIHVTGVDYRITCNNGNQRTLINP